MTDKIMSPELEQDYLIYYSKLCVALGCFLTFISIDRVFDISELGTLFKSLSYIVAGVLVITTLYYLFAGIRFSDFSLSKNAWTGTFNDEYLNSINLNAYKGAFFTVMVTALVATLGVFDWLNVSTEALATFIMGTSFTTYGIIALFKLRDQDE